MIQRNYLCRITAPHFCAGLIVRRGDLTVIQTAPILRYMTAWPAQRVRQYCTGKRWDLEIFLDPLDTSRSP